MLVGRSRRAGGGTYRAGSVRLASTRPTKTCPLEHGMPFLGRPLHRESNVCFRGASPAPPEVYHQWLSSTSSIVPVACLECLTSHRDILLPTHEQHTCPHGLSSLFASVLIGHHVCVQVSGRASTACWRGLHKAENASIDDCEQSTEACDSPGVLELFGVPRHCRRAGVLAEDYVVARTKALLFCRSGFLHLVQMDAFPHLAVGVTSAARMSQPMSPCSSLGSQSIRCSLTMP